MKQDENVLSLISEQQNQKEKTFTGRRKSTKYEVLRKLSLMTDVR
jgi:hypothetical protein